MRPSPISHVAFVCLLAGRGGLVAGSSVPDLPVEPIPIQSIVAGPLTLPEVSPSSGLPVTWELLTGPAALSGNVVTLTGSPGGVTLRARQPEDGEWAARESWHTFAVTEEGAWQSMAVESANDRSAIGITERGWMYQFESRDGQPVIRRVGDGETWRSADAGSLRFLAVTAQGRLWSWGYNVGSQLGFGPGPNLSEPMLLSDEPVWSQVKCGYRSSVAMRSDGSVWLWPPCLSCDPGPTLPVRSPVPVPAAQLSGEVIYGVNVIGTDGSVWQVASGAYPILPAYPWRQVTSTRGGTVGIRQDGTLGFAVPGSDGVRVLSAETDWAEVRGAGWFYFALKADHSLWAGQLNWASAPEVPPREILPAARWRSIHPGGLTGAAVKSDGSLWAMGPWTHAVPGSPVYAAPLSGRQSWPADLVRIAPAFFLQRCPFADFREQPLPVVTGGELPMPGLTSALPVVGEIVSGPAVVDGETIRFTGDGLVRLRVSHGGDDVWGPVDQEITFLAGPELAVHAGADVRTPAVADHAPDISLGRLTRSQAEAGVLQVFTLENTGVLPLRVSGIGVVPGSAIRVIADFSGAVLAPGESVTVAFRISCAEYGDHRTEVRFLTDDGDESAFTVSFRLAVANTAPVASAGPDRSVPAGRFVRLYAAEFCQDAEQPADSLTYQWDLDGDGFYQDATGAAPQITLAREGEVLDAALKITDGDGATATANVRLTASAPDAPRTAAIGIRPGADGGFTVEMVFPAGPGRACQLEVSSDLLWWAPHRDAYQPEALTLRAGDDGYVPATSGLNTGYRLYYRLSMTGQ